MRAIIVVLVVVLILTFAGWLVFDFSGNRAGVEIRPQKIEQDTKKLIDGAKATLHDADERINKPTETE